MIKGLLWLPLLVVFVWLAWAGWNEYQKVEAYRLWAQQFQRAKYDIYAVLGQNGNEITWGKPTRKGPVNLDTFSLENVSAIRLVVDGQLLDSQSVDKTHLPQNSQKIHLEFQMGDHRPSIFIPFTDLNLAVQWLKYLTSPNLK
jgi:hypothetical protein